MSAMLRVPFHDDETLASFLSRMARVNGRNTLSGFLKDFALSPLRVHHGDRAELDKLSHVTGIPAEVLYSRAVRVKGTVTEYRGETFHRLAIERTRLRVCSHCLQEDERNSSCKPGTRMYARAVWMVPAVVSCPRHDRTFTAVAVNFDGIPDLYRALEKAQREIADGLTTSSELSSTAFEKFVERRLSGLRRDGELLDGASLQTAIDLCQIFGFASVHGRKFHVRGASNDTLSVASQLGFDALGRGREGVFAILDRLAAQKSESSIRGGFAIYGNLYFLLTRPTRGTEYDRVRELVREHAARAVATLPAARIFGKVGDTGTVNMNALVRKARVHPATVARYLQQNSSVEEMDKPEFGQFVDAATASRAVADLSDTILMPAVSEILGWNIHDCRRLAEMEILPAAVKRDMKGYGLKQRYSPTFAIALKESLISRANYNPSQLQSLRALRLSIVSGHDDVLKAVFDGRLRHMAYAEHRSILDAVQVDLWEVIRHCAEVTLSPKAINRLLGFERLTFLRLLEIGAFSNATPGTTVSIKADDVVSFDSAYITSARVKREHMLRRGDFDAMMDINDIDPAFPLHEVGQMILRRLDIPRLLSAGPTPIRMRAN